MSLHPNMVALAAAICVAWIAEATWPTPVRAAEVVEDVTFAGSQQDFGLTLVGSGTLTVSGNARVHHIIDIPLLPDLHTHTDITIPLQTFPISLSPMTVNLSSTPSGSATIGYDDVDLSNATLSDFNVDFRNNASWNFGLNDIVIQADVNPPDLIPDFGADIKLSTNIAINQFSFTGNGPATIFPSSGTFPTVQQVAVQNGTLNASVAGSVTGTVDLGIFGTSSLGEIATINTAIADTDFDLPSTITLTAQDGPPATQVTTNLALDLPISVDLPYSASDTITQNDPHSDGSLDLNLSYGLQGDLTLSNLSYDLTNVNQVPSVPVALQNATATFSQTGFPVSNVLLPNSDGWAISQPGGTNPEIAVFETVEDLGGPGGTTLTFTLQHGNPATLPHQLGRFRLSVTTDDRSLFADGLASGGDVTANWIVLDPISAISAGGATITEVFDNSLIVSGINPPNDTYTVIAETNLQGITGFRLEALAHSSLPQAGPGRSSGGNFVLTQFSVSAAVVPEPSALAMAAMAILGGLLLPRRPHGGKAT